MLAAPLLSKCKLCSFEVVDDLVPNQLFLLLCFVLVRVKCTSNNHLGRWRDSNESSVCGTERVIAVAR